MTQVPSTGLSRVRDPHRRGRGDVCVGKPSRFEFKKQRSGTLRNGCPAQAAAEKQFKDVQAQFSGTDAADVADLYLARIEAQHGNTASAPKRLEHFVSAHPKHMLVGGARYSLYQLRIDAGEGPQVAQELQAQIGKPDAPLPSDTLLVLLAHAYDAQGNADKSKDAYRRIVTEFPDSPYAVEAQRKVGGAA